MATEERGGQEKNGSAERPDLALYGELGANIVGFCRLLRRAGVGVGPSEAAAALQAVTKMGAADAEGFRLALLLTLAKSPGERRIFARHFAAYWMVWDRATQLNRGKARRQEVERRREEPPRAALVTISDWLKSAAAVEDEREAAGYSPYEVLSRRDFSRLGPDEDEEIGRLVDEVARRLATRFNRRYRRGRRGRLDLRRSLRLGLRRGGELLDLAHKRRRRRRLKLVLLCDVSKSMDLYSRFLVRFLYVFQHAYRRIETFAFSTGLHRVTRTLKEDDLAAALAQLALRVPDWSGGTRIGEALETFWRRHAGLVDGNTVVLIISDGWDTGDTEPLVEGMRRLRRGARSVIWLNPLMGSPDFAPTVRGMEAALPYIDLLAPAHNVESLRQLARHLGRVQRGGGLGWRPPSAPAKAAAAATPPEAAARRHPLLDTVRGAAGEEGQE